MNTKHFIHLAIIVIALLPRSVWGWRTVTTTLGIQKYIAVTIHNPSSVPQVIQVTMGAIGSGANYISGSGAGGSSMTCTSGPGNTCKISGAGNQYTIPPNGIFKAQVTGYYGSNTSDGAVIQIQVQDSSGGNQGYVVATSEFSYATTDYHAFPINAGRPF